MSRLFAPLAAVCAGFLLPAPAQSLDDSHKLDGYRGAYPVVTRKNASPKATAANLLDQAVKALQSGDASETQEILSKMLDVNGNQRRFLYYIAGDKVAADRFQRFAQLIESSRMDKQCGAGLVSKPSTTAVLSAAVETAQTTFRGNAVGIGRMLLAEEPFPFCGIEVRQCDSPAVRALNGLSFSVSAAGRVSAWGLRYGLYNHRNPNSQASRRNFSNAYAKAIRDQGLADAALAAQTKISAVLDQLTGNDANRASYTKWFTDSLNALSRLPKETTLSELEDQLASHLDDLVMILKGIDPVVEEEAVQALEGLDVYFETRKDLLAAANNGNIFTFEYTVTAPLNQPRTSDLRLIFSWQPQDRILLTFNAASAMAGHWRDAQAAAQIDIALGQIGTTTAPIFSAAEYFRGNTVIGEFKLTFPLKTSGVSIPFAVTWANRTVSAHFGLNFDLGILLAKK